MKHRLIALLRGHGLMCLFWCSEPMHHGVNYDPAKHESWYREQK